MSLFSKLWPTLAAMAWFQFVEHVEGERAALYAAVTGLAVCILAFCEAGKDGGKAEDLKDGSVPLPRPIPPANR